MAPPEITDAYVGLGANMGNRLAALQQAVQSMASWPGTVVIAASSIYETEAHVRPGTHRQPDHLNAVVHLQTDLAPIELLNRLHGLERAAGRDVNAPPWSPRPLDLDLLVAGSEHIDTDELVIPHPRLADRRFVLQPLADVAPSLRIGDKTVSELLAQTSDRARIDQTDHVLIHNDVHES